MTDMFYDYLIIGNSAAGVSAAESIRENDRTGSIVIIGAEPYEAYGRPLISYMVEGKTTVEKMNFKDPDFYDRNNINTMLGSEFEVIELIPGSHEVKLANGNHVGYGKCLLATGSIPFTPPIPGLREGKNVYAFMTLDDAESAWNATVDATVAAHDASRPSRVLVIGSGLIGLKAAEALSYHADEVVVLELAPRILPAVLDDAGSQILAELLEEKGIICMPGISADELILDGEFVTGAKLTNGETISCDLVIAAVGVRPNSSLAVNAGAEEGRGLVVDNQLRTTLEDVYAAGDVTQVKDILDGSLHPLALWPNAVKQGKIAGMQMAGNTDTQRYVGSFAVNAVDFFEYSLLTSGIINPQPDMECEVETIVDDDTYAKFVRKDDKLVGYILLNRPANAGIYTAIIETRVPLQELDPQIFDAAPQNLDFPKDRRWTRLHHHYPADLNELGRKKD